MDKERGDALDYERNDEKAFERTETFLLTEENAEAFFPLLPEEYQTGRSAEGIQGCVTFRSLSERAVELAFLYTSRKGSVRIRSDHYSTK